MKYCTHCGAEIEDDAVICVNCGCATNDGKEKSSNNGNLGKIALVFMILGCIATPLMGVLNFLTAEDAAFGLGQLIGGFLALAWCIPMTIHFGLKLKRGETVGTAFKVCSLLFVNIIAGILMLCMRSDNK